MLRYKIISFVVVFALILGFVPFFQPKEIKNAFGELKASAVKNTYQMAVDTDSADSSVIIDTKSGTVLYSKNASVTRGMASTTKIMTALVVIENCHPETEFVIPKEAVGIEGSSVYLLEGERLTVKELLYCLLLESGNDSAVALSLACSGNLDSFVDLMNQRAIELGLENTHFTNPHGLSDENHYTTAYDLAVITAEAMKYPLFCEIVATKTATVRYDGVDGQRYLTNHNKLLFGFEGAKGVKTGYTMKDGKCLVSSAERNGLELICVTLHDNSPTYNHIRLLNLAFLEFENVKVADIGEFIQEVPISNLENRFLRVTNYETGSVLLPKGGKLEAEILLPESINAPIYEGEIIGQINFYYDGNLVYIINLESDEEILLPKKNFWEKIFGD